MTERLRSIKALAAEMMYDSPPEAIAQLIRDAHKRLPWQAEDVHALPRQEASS